MVVVLVGRTNGKGFIYFSKLAEYSKYKRRKDKEIKKDRKFVKFKLNPNANRNISFTQRIGQFYFAEFFTHSFYLRVNLFTAIHFYRILYRKSKSLNIVSCRMKRNRHTTAKKLNKIKENIELGKLSHCIEYFNQSNQINLTVGPSSTFPFIINFMLASIEFHSFSCHISCVKTKFVYLILISVSFAGN